MLRILALAMLATGVSAAVAPLTAEGESLSAGDPRWPGGSPAGMLRLGSQAITPTMQQIRLGPLPSSTPGATLAFLAMVHASNPRQPREARLLADDAKGKPRELARMRIMPGAWQALRWTATIPEEGLGEATLYIAGADPVYLTAAVCSDDGEAALHHLGLRPNPLLALGYDGSKGLPQTGRIWWSAFPRANPELRLLAPDLGGIDSMTAAMEAIALGWNTLPEYRPRADGRSSSDADDPFAYQPSEALGTAEQIRLYTQLKDMGAHFSQALGERPQILLLHLTTITHPGITIDGLSKLATTALRSGTIVGLVLESRPDDSRVQKSWAAWIAALRNLEPALPIIDLAISEAWHHSPGAQADATGLLLGTTDTRYTSLTEACADLRARLEWVIFDARDEVDVDPDRPRRPGPTIVTP